MGVHSPSAETSRASLRLRPACSDDLPSVVAIERASFSDPWSRQAFVDSLSDPVRLFLVAVDGSVVAGYVIAWFVAGEGEIANIAVAPAWRGRGIGAALLDAALAAGTSRGATAIYLEVRESNAPARALYASRAFQEVGRRRGYYRRPLEDAIVLRRDAGRGTRDWGLGARD